MEVDKKEIHRILKLALLRSAHPLNTQDLADDIKDLKLALVEWIKKHKVEKENEGGCYECGFSMFNKALDTLITEIGQ